MEKLKVLWFNWRCPKHPQAGGAEKATYEIARRWVRWGNQVHLVSASFPGGKSCESIEGITVTRIGGKYSVYAKSMFYYLIHLRGKYDIVIDEINTVPFLTTLYVKEPHVAFIHQLAANVLFDELPPVQAAFLNFIEPNTLSLYKNVTVFTSQSTKQDLVKIGFKESNIHTVNYGVDHSVYRIGKGKSPFPHVIYLGRLKKFKGVHILINAMAIVAKEIPDAKLTIVGNGDDDYQAELETLSIKLKLTDKVRFCNFGFHDSLAQKVSLMQEAWVLCFPSSREGFGLVVVEANACGTPTIAADVPGLRETVRNYDTGILVCRDAKAMAESIKQVLRERELRENLSKRAIDWSMQFDWDKTSWEMLKVLSCIANKNKG
jgi:glycosyltransferase involved in cell wall biosynthesis